MLTALLLLTALSGATALKFRSDRLRKDFDR